MEEKERKEDIDNLDIELEALVIKENDEKTEIKRQLKIILGDKELLCDIDVLKRQSRYFEAFINFDPDREEVEIKGGVEESACSAIIDHFNGEELKINEDNFQDLLQGKFSGIATLQNISTHDIICRLNSNTLVNFAGRI